MEVGAYEFWQERICRAASVEVFISAVRLCRECLATLEGACKISVCAREPSICDCISG
jgi:hypothetical protein